MIIRIVGWRDTHGTFRSTGALQDEGGCADEHLGKHHECNACKLIDYEITNCLVPWAAFPSSKLHAASKR